MRLGGGIIILDVLHLDNDGSWMGVNKLVVVLNDHAACCFVAFLVALPTFGSCPSTIDIFCHNLLNYMYKISSQHY